MTKSFCYSEQFVSSEIYLLRESIIKNIEFKDLFCDECNVHHFKCSLFSVHDVTASFSDLKHCTRAGDVCNAKVRTLRETRRLRTFDFGKRAIKQLRFCKCL